MFFSSEGWIQEVIALGLTALAVLYAAHRLTGWPRRRPREAPERTPDDVQIGGRLARGLDKVSRTKRS